MLTNKFSPSPGNPVCLLNFDMSVHYIILMDEGPGSSHKGKKIKSYTVGFKLKVVQYAKDTNNHKAARTFDVDRKRVIEWRKKEEDLKAMDGKTSKKRIPGGGKKVGNVDIDTQLRVWMEVRRDKGGCVTGKSLKRECIRLHRLNGNQSFKASCGWLRSFMKRHNVSFRRPTHIAQKLPAELDEKRQNFWSFIIRMRRLRNYDLSMIGNMDETPIWIDMPGASTLDSVGSKTVSVKTTGHEKSRITVMLSAMADGTKLPPMVLLKGVRRPKEIPSGIQVLMLPKAWANEDAIKQWLLSVWKRNNQSRRLLIWDAFSAHITPAIKKEVRTRYNSDMAVIPGGCTSKLQPCDVSWNKPFKDNFHDLYNEWLIDGQIELTRGGNRKPPSSIIMLRWIKSAWGDISPNVIKKSFEVTGITLPMDGSRDDLIFQSGEESDDDPFEGFTQAEVEEATLVHENHAAMVIDDDEYNEPSDVSADSEDDYVSVDSPGR